MPTNVGTANYASHFGVPTLTLTWTGRSTASRAGTIHNAVEIALGGDITPTRDNVNEIQALRMTNETMQFMITVKPVGANNAAALAIMGDLPKKNSIVTVSADAADTDLSTSGTIIVDDCRKRYTPDGEGVIDFTVTKHIGKTFSALS